jgi:hypothetical protein
MLRTRILAPPTKSLWKADSYRRACISLTKHFALRFYPPCSIVSPRLLDASEIFRGSGSKKALQGLVDFVGLVCFVGFVYFVDLVDFVGLGYLATLVLSLSTRLPAFLLTENSKNGMIL